ncbi:MAG: YHS domain-containing protein, partial [Anaerolineales bacterium]
AEVVQFRRRPSATPTLTPTQTLTEAIDPVCGMTVETATARYTSVLDGQVYYFCCAGCKRAFENETEKYRVASDG